MERSVGLELETFRRGDEIVVRIDLPGLKPEDVNVEVTDDSVIVSGERQQAQDDEGEGWYRSERSYGRFYREIPLPEGAQPDTTRANFRDGVLEMSVKAPPREVTKPRRIEIGASPTSDRGARRRRPIARRNPSGHRLRTIAPPRAPEARKCHGARVPRC